MDLSKATEEEIKEYKEQWQKDCYYIHTSDRRLGYCIEWCRNNIDLWHFSSIKLNNKIYFCFKEDAEELNLILKEKNWVGILKNEN